MYDQARLALQEWPDSQGAVIIAIESVQLAPPMAARISGQRLFVMFSFLPSLCGARQQQTKALPASKQPIHLGFCLVRTSLVHLNTVTDACNGVHSLAVCQEEVGHFTTRLRHDHHCILLAWMQ